MDSYGLVPNAYQGVWEGLKYLQKEDQFDRQMALKEWQAIQDTAQKSELLKIRQREQALNQVKFDYEKGLGEFNSDMKIYDSLVKEGGPSQAADWVQKKLETIDKKKQPNLWSKYNMLATGGKAVADDMKKQSKVLSDLTANGKADVKNLLAAQAAAGTQAGRMIFDDAIKIQKEIDATYQKAKVLSEARKKGEKDEREKKIYGYRNKLAQLELAKVNLEKGLTLKQQMERKMITGTMGLDRGGDAGVELKAVNEQMAWLRRRILELDPSGAGGQKVLDFSLQDKTFSPSTGY